MATGTLIAESLRAGARLELPLTLTAVERVDAGERSPAQLRAGVPAVWTLLRLELPDADAGALAARLAELLGEVGWYADLRTADETFVVFAGRVIRYPLGDGDGRREAEVHGRAVGVPDAQLDWP